MKRMPCCQEVALAEEEHELEEGPNADGGPQPQAGPAVTESTSSHTYYSMCEPLWKLDEPVESPLKVLQVLSQASCSWRVLTTCLPEKVLDGSMCTGHSAAGRVIGSGTGSLSQLSQTY
jgi:hypothetical protein